MEGEWYVTPLASHPDAGKAVASAGRMIAIRSVVSSLLTTTSRTSSSGNQTFTATKPALSPVW